MHVIDGRNFAERQPMGGYSASLHTIPHHVEIVAECLSCGRVKQIDRHAIAAQFQFRPLNEIQAALKCECGNKNAKIMTGFFTT